MEGLFSHFMPSIWNLLGGHKKMKLENPPQHLRDADALLMLMLRAPVHENEVARFSHHHSPPSPNRSWTDRDFRIWTGKLQKASKQQTYGNVLNWYVCSLHIRIPDERTFFHAIKYKRQHCSHTKAQVQMTPFKCGQLKAFRLNI